MITPKYITNKIVFKNPETDLLEELPFYIEYYESKTNKLLGKVFKKSNPHTYWFIPEPDSNLSIIKIPLIEGGSAKLYVEVCEKVKEIYRKL